MIDTRLKMKGVADSLTSELERNDRLRRMIWLIAYIVVLYVITFLHDANNLAAQRIDTLSQQLSRIGNTDEVEVWERRLAHESDVFETLKSGCWQAKTPELASADMQTVISQLAGAYSLEAVRLDLAEPEYRLLSGTNSWLIRAQLSAKADSGVVPLLVNALESSQSFFAIERLRFIQRRGGSLDLLLAACFLEVK